MIHTVKGFSIVNKAEVNVLLELPYFLHDPTNIGNLVSSSSASLKPSLYIQKFLVHTFLKPSLKDFAHNLASMWNEWNWAVVWPFFGIALLWEWNENWPFPVLWPLLSFPGLLAQWVQHFHSSIFQGFKQLIWNSLTFTGFVLMKLPKAHLIYTPECLALGKWPHYHDYLGHNLLN